MSTRACPSCGVPTGSGARFCSACGARLERPTEACAPVAGAFDAERKQVTVLFADLRGSTEVLAHLDPEDARQVIDPVLALMMDAVHAFGGTVNQVMGDGVMAMFGAPAALEDHPLRACLAALAMQRDARALSERLGASLGVDVKLRIGLNTGDVVARPIGSDLRVDYTAVGLTTHLAARMEQAAEPGSVLLTLDTARAAGVAIRVSARGPVAVRGVDAPVEAFVLLEADPRRARGPRAAPGHRTSSFVGRREERDALEALLDRAATGSGGVACVIAEPGCGKSRLVEEVARARVAAGWRLLESRGDPFDVASPLRSVRAMLATHLGGAADADPADRLGRGRERLDALGVPRDSLAAAGLRLLLGDDSAAPDWRELDPALRALRLREAVVELLRAESRAAPTLVVMEDAHWFDRETLALLAGLATAASDARLAVVVTARTRPEVLDEGASDRLDITLAPLDATDSMRMIDELVGPAPELESVREAIRSRAEGNPFFIEETVSAFVDAGVLAGEPGAMRPGPAPTATPRIPTTVHAVLAARIDGLDADDKRVLQAASVIGRRFDLALLATTAGLARGALDESVARLRRAGLVLEAEHGSGEAAMFRHALTQDVAYGSLSRERRAALHGGVLRALQAHDGTGRAAPRDLLGTHALGCRAWDLAAELLSAAGVAALAIGAFDAADEQFVRALSAVDRLADADARHHRRVALLFRRFDALLPLGRYGSLRDALSALDAELPFGNDDARARLDSCRAHVAWIHEGRNGDGIALARRALAACGRTGDARLAVATRFYLGQLLYSAGEHVASAAELAQIAAVTRPAPGASRFDRFFGIISRSWSAYPLVALGRLDDARRLCDEALRAARRGGASVDVLASLVGTAVHRVAAGLPHEAIDAVEAARAVAGYDLLMQWRAPLDTVHGAALNEIGRAGDAERLLASSLVRNERLGLVAHRTDTLAQLAESQWRLGRLDDARRTAEAACVRAAQLGEPGFGAMAERVLARIARDRAAGSGAGAA